MILKQHNRATEKDRMDHRAAGRRLRAVGGHLAGVSRRGLSSAADGAAPGQASACRAAASELTQLMRKGEEIAVVAGLDGYVDNIIDVVDARTGPTEYTPIGTIADLGSRISAAAGKSGNLEFVIKLEKLGGNGPIMSNAMLAYGIKVTYMGMLGLPAPHAVFGPMVAASEEAISLGNPGVTDALEFNDGKIMVNKSHHFKDLTYDFIKKSVGLEVLRSRFSKAKAIATVNWNSILGMTGIWEGLARDVLPGLPGPRRLFFVDLCDPRKRTREDLRRCMDTLQLLEKHVNVLLSLNFSEAKQCLEVLGGKYNGNDEDAEASRVAAVQLQKLLGIHMVSIHQLASCSAATASESYAVPGYFTAKPKLTTGGGDNFNAGLLSALLIGCKLDTALRVAGATTGYYVRNGTSPSLQDIVGFLQNLPPLDRLK